MSGDSAVGYGQGSVGVDVRTRARSGPDAIGALESTSVERTAKNSRALSDCSLAVPKCCIQTASQPIIQLHCLHHAPRDGVYGCGDVDACDRNTEEWGASEEIFAAASDGNVSRLEELVSRGANIDAKVGRHGERQ